MKAAPRGQAVPARCAWLCLPLAALLLAAGGCATAPLQTYRSALYATDPEAGESALAEPLRARDRDWILLLMERGMLAHSLGRYEESNRALLEAAQRIEKEEQFRLSEELASMVAGERMLTYPGEEFEKVLVHTFAALNFLALGEPEPARVEAKRALKRLGTLEEDSYDQPFARYVAAVAYEAAGDLNDAYIEYRKVHELLPELALARADLLRSTRLLGWQEEEEAWQKKFTDTPVPDYAEPGGNELIVFLAAGRGPAKRTRRFYLGEGRFIAIPSYVPFSYSAGTDHAATVRVDGGEPQQAYLLSDVGELAISSLEQRLVKYLLKETARAATREVIVEQIREETGDTGEVIARVLLLLAQPADTRCWGTLPAALLVARIPIAAGEHEVQVDAGAGSTSRLLPITVRAGQPAVVTVRLP